MIEDNQLIDLLNEYSSTIDLCRLELMKIEPRAESTFYYAVLRMYSRVIISSCEIFTLLKEGYPHGAMSLSRQVYEGLVIIDVLLKSEEDGDNDMPTRFFDAARISELKYYELLTKLSLNDEANNAEVISASNRISSELDEFKTKYPNKQFRDYWWAECRTFDDLVKISRHEKYHTYKLACMNTHLNAYSALEYLDHSQGDIIIGEQNDGMEMPLWYTVLCLAAITIEINKRYQDICPQNVAERFLRLEQKASEYVKMVNRKRQARMQ